MSDHVSSYLRATPPPEGFVPVDSWRAQAACFEHPRLRPETWDDTHPDDSGRNGRNRPKRIKAAVLVCDTECPVKDACLLDVDLRYDEGVRRIVSRPAAPTSRRGGRPRT
jgi:hypothetical protein